PSGFRKDVPHLQVSVLAAERFERPRKKNTRHLRRVKFREEKCRESFAASKAYDIPTRRVVAIHTQHRGNRWVRNREIIVNGRSGLGRRQLAETVMSARLWL